MLIGLEISNFAIVSQLSIEWDSGMSTITGETGAGKSIAIDALSLCLGERAEASMVRSGHSKAEVCAIFDITELPNVQHFLSEQQLHSDNECIIRRVISHNGRSKAYLNGSLVSVNQLKVLAPLLVAIHGQHAHQNFTKSEHQLTMLDNYAAHHTLMRDVKNAYEAHQAYKKEFKQLQQQAQQQQAEKQLLQYQVEELDEFNLVDGEYQQIEQTHTRLSHSNTLMEQSHKELQVLYQQEGFNAFSIIQSSANQLANYAELDTRLSPIVDLLFEAGVQVEEAARELSQYQQQIELDPSQLAELEERLSKTLDLARKHDVAPELLAEHHQHLAKRLNNIESDNERLTILEQACEKSLQTYQAKSQQLSLSRQKAAQGMGQHITKAMRTLAMEQAQFEITVDFNHEAAPSMTGSDSIDYLVSTNPGQPIQPLIKVASGGELSRISLAIEVLIANNMTTPTLIFDEVDVGISGPTASAVGNLLRELGASTQVICVTHLPQVACCGHHQYFVEKSNDGTATNTTMVTLDEAGRIDEIARLLGGVNISDITRTNAQELLYQTH